MVRDHDRLFKELLTTFFTEFVEVFLPDVDNYLERGSVQFLDKEIFTDVTAGDKYKVDLVARAKIKGEDAFFLIHVEHQSTPQREFGKRMHRYFARLHDKFDLPVYPVVIFSYDKPRRAEPDHYHVRIGNQLVLNFWYHVIQLNRLSWRDYAKQKNPVAIALMAKMHIDPKDRVRVKLECLRILTTLRLDPARESVISGFVGTYLELLEAEERQYMAEVTALPSPEKEEVMELMTSWERKGRAEGLQEGIQKGIQEGIQRGLQKGLQEGISEGRQEGTRSVALRLLRLRLGELPQVMEDRVRALSYDQLELLCVATFSIASVADLEVWLARQAS